VKEHYREKHQDVHLKVLDLIFNGDQDEEEKNKKEKEEEELEKKKMKEEKESEEKKNLPPPLPLLLLPLLRPYILFIVPPVNLLLPLFAIL
jgi:uncharacterized protein with ParB-like and HNH nuclease domain